MTSDPRVISLIVRYEELCEQGQTADLAALCGDTPDLLPAVEEGVRKLKPVKTKPRQALVSVAPDGYELQDEIGSGGMGQVFRAYHAALDREVAIKFLHPRYTPGTPVAAAVSRKFLEEARIAAKLQHPGIPAVHEVGALPDGRPFLAMKLIRGKTLAALLKEQGHGSVKWLGVFEAVCQAVGAAHAAGYIHRDLKPLNIMVGAFGEVQVMDWGLAKLVDRPRPNGVPEGDSSPPPTADDTVDVVRAGPGDDTDATRVGDVKGTLLYMPPEQARGEIDFINRRADVFALGAILCELLTGQTPLSGTKNQILGDLIAERFDAAYSRLDGCGEDPALIALAKRCLAAKPESRPTDASEVATAVAQFRAESEARAKQAELERGKAEVQAAEREKQRQLQATEDTRRRRVWRFAASGIGLVLVIGTAVSLGFGLYANEQAVVARREKQNAADSAEVAATEEYFRVLTDLRDRRATTTPGSTERGIAAIRKLTDDALPTAVRLPELRTEAVNLLTSVDINPGRDILPEEAAALVFHPAGNWVAVGHAKAQAFAVCNVSLVDPATCKLIETLRFSPSLNFQLKTGKQDGPRSLAVSPDGRWVVAGARSGQLHIWDMGAAVHTPISWQGHESEVSQIAFALDSKSFYSGCNGGVVHRWEMGKTTPKSKWKTPAGGILGLAVLADGTVACVRDDTAADTIRFDPDLKPKEDHWWLDSGTFIPLSGGDLWVVAQRGQLKVSDPRRRSALPLRRFLATDRDTAHDGNIWRIAANGDGKLLASIGEDNRVRVWDTVAVRLLLDFPLQLEDTAVIAWHPKALMLVVAAAGRVLAYDMTSGDGLIRLPLSGFARGVAWSCYGKQLAATSWAGGNESEVRVWEADDRFTLPLRARCTDLPNAHPGLAFAPDGTRLLARTQGGMTYFDTGTARNLGSTPVDTLNALGWRVDGQVWAAASSEVLSWQADGRPGEKYSNRSVGMISGRGWVSDVAVGREWVLAGCGDGAVRVLSPVGATLTHTWMVKGGVGRVALSPDQTIAVVGTDAGEVRLMRVPKGEDVGRQPNAHRDRVSAAVFVSDRLLVTGSRDSTVKLWTRTDTGLSEVFTLPTGGAVESLATSPNGMNLLVATKGELGVRVWRLDRLHTGLKMLGLRPEFEPGYWPSVV